jgi:ABC-type multidrug transport system fused ATPase/permease subunit
LAIELQQYGIALRRALRLTQTAMEPQTGGSVKTGKGQIEFKDVHFSYTPDREALSGLSLKIKPGQFVGLVGPSGAGKTTTVDLLMRLYEPSSGAILIDGQKLSDLNASSVRRAIGVVAAEGTVFRGTLADNIRYERPDASAQDVYEAALAAGHGVALDRLPNGLLTHVGEGGIGLSVGERQRLQLARVMAANPHIMVLDEATANLDYNTEVEVKRALATLRKDKTTIVIAHRFSMVKDAECIYVLEAGRVVEAGAPEDLIADGGWFAGFAASGNGVEDGVDEVDDNIDLETNLLEEEEEEEED